MAALKQRGVEALQGRAVALCGDPVPEACAAEEVERAK